MILPIDIENKFNVIILKLLHFSYLRTIFQNKAIAIGPDKVLCDRDYGPDRVNPKRLSKNQYIHIIYFILYLFSR